MVRPTSNQAASHVAQRVLCSRRSAFEITFYHILVVRTLLPLLVIVALALRGWWLLRVRQQAADGRLSAASKSASDSLFSWVFFLIFLMYPGCSFTAFSTFICSELDDGTRYLRRGAPRSIARRIASPRRVASSAMLITRCAWQMRASTATIRRRR